VVVQHVLKIQNVLQRLALLDSVRLVVIQVKALNVQEHHAPQMLTVFPILVSLALVLPATMESQAVIVMDLLALVTINACLALASIVSVNSVQPLFSVMDKLAIQTLTVLLTHVSELYA
jgi:hypothetical protein